MSNQNKTLSKAIGEHIRRLRKARGWSQTELGAHAGISRATIAQIELGRYRSVDLDTVVALAKALGVSPSILIDGATAEEGSLQKAVEEFKNSYWAKAMSPTEEELQWLANLPVAVWVGVEPGAETVADILAWRRKNLTQRRGT